MSLKTKGIFRFLTLLTAFSAPALAATPPPQLVLETAYIKPVKPVTKFGQAEAKKLIPMNLQPGVDDENSIGRKILDNGMQTLGQNELIKNSEIGKAAKGVEDALKTDIVIGGGQGSRQHRVQMQMLAFQGQAKMEYRGLLNVDMTFGSTGMQVDINERLSDTAKLNLNHTSQDSASKVQIVWTW